MVLIWPNKAVQRRSFVNWYNLSPLSQTCEKDIVKFQFEVLTHSRRRAPSFLLRENELACQISSSLLANAILEALRQYTTLWRFKCKKMKSSPWFDCRTRLTRGEWKDLSTSKISLEELDRWGCEPQYQHGEFLEQVFECPSQVDLLHCQLPTPLPHLQTNLDEYCAEIVSW